MTRLIAICTAVTVGVIFVTFLVVDVVYVWRHRKAFDRRREF